MALADAFLSLKNVQVTLSNGSTADITQIDFKRTIQKDDRTAGSSLVVQKVLDESDLEIEFEGWNSNNLSMADLTPGTAVVDLTVVTTNGTQDVLWADTYTKFPVPWYLGDTNTSLGPKPSKWKTMIHTNVVGVAGVVI